ncbi:unnamed protein product [Nezara viridula]|uniref:Uncharacterized protein n=1 Tax=Nezara viridula TaxID=85310 RepID=A0A9P0MGH3_NEZVI|nr:unnamed protein product [Nezara viridula]
MFRLKDAYPGRSCRQKAFILPRKCSKRLLARTLALESYKMHAPRAELFLVHCHVDAVNCTCRLPPF